jgi:hypothetical protein
MKVAWLLAPRTGRLYPPGKTTGTNVWQRVSRPQGSCAATTIGWMKNLKDRIGRRAPDLPACSAVPSPTPPPWQAGVNRKVVPGKQGCTELSNNNNYYYCTYVGFYCTSVLRPSIPYHLSTFWMSVNVQRFEQDITSKYHGFEFFVTRYKECVEILYTGMSTF